jgi:hypothetical protein
VSEEIDHERFRIIEGLLREIVANTTPAPEASPAGEMVPPIPLPAAPGEKEKS